MKEKVNALHKHKALAEWTIERMTRHRYVKAHIWLKMPQRGVRKEGEKQSP